MRLYRAISREKEIFFLSFYLYENTSCNKNKNKTTKYLINNKKKIKTKVNYIFLFFTFKFRKLSFSSLLSVLFCLLFAAAVFNNDAYIYILLIFFSSLLGRSIRNFSK